MYKERLAEDKSYSLLKMRTPAYKKRTNRSVTKFRVEMTIRVSTRLLP